MTQRQYIINRKLNIIELAEKLGNISEASRRLGVSRQHFYDLKGAVQEHGIEGLLEQSRRKPRYANRVAEDVEKKVMEYCLEFPTQGQVRVSNELLNGRFGRSDPPSPGFLTHPKGDRTGVNVSLRHFLQYFLGLPASAPDTIRLLA